MTFSIQLRRIGTSRISEFSIPIEARVSQGGKLGEDLLAGRNIRDMTYAKETVEDILCAKLRQRVTVNFTDVTQYTQTGA